MNAVSTTTSASSLERLVTELNAAGQFFCTVGIYTVRCDKARIGEDGKLECFSMAAQMWLPPTSMSFTGIDGKAILVS